MTANHIGHPCMAVHNRRRSQHNRRPPPAPVRLFLHTGSPLRFVPANDHNACVADILRVTQRVAKHLFCTFDRWAAAVHRPNKPTTVPQASAALGLLKKPISSLRLRVQFDQVNAYSLGPGLTLATDKLRRCEQEDLRWLAHASRAWRIKTGHKTPVRDSFVGDTVLCQAHAKMVRSDGDAWGGLVPVQLVPMVNYDINGCKLVSNND